MKEEKESNELE